MQYSGPSLLAVATGIVGSAWTSGTISSLSVISLPAVRTVPETSTTAWTELYARGANFVPKVALVVTGSYLYAAYDTYNRHGGWEGFAAAAACVMSIVPFTLLVMKGTNDKLHKAAKDGLKGTDSQVASDMDIWGIMNFTRSLLPLVGTILGVRAFLANTSL